MTGDDVRPSRMVDVDFCRVEDLDSTFFSSVVVNLCM